MQTVRPSDFDKLAKGIEESGYGDPVGAVNQMLDKGYRLYDPDGRLKDAAPLVKRLEFDNKREEANGVTALGALTRSGVSDLTETDVFLIEEIEKLIESEISASHLVERQEMTPINILEFSRLREAEGDENGTVRVVLITEGKGNKRDKNYYPPETLRESYKVFEGVKCFLNHPSRSEEHERPERDVRDICGWFSDVALQPIDGKLSVIGTLNFSSNDAGREARGLVESEREYQQKQSGDGVLVGFSINAEGPSHDELMDNEMWNRVDGIEKAMSADLVTFPARGGRVLGFREAEARYESMQWRRALEDSISWREAFTGGLG